MGIVVRLLFCFLFLITGCVVSPSFKDKLDSVVGKTEDGLIASWGVPDKTFTTSDSTFLTYITNKGEGVYQYSNGFSRISTISENSCEITFRIRKKIVESYNLRGNNCPLF